MGDDTGGHQLGLFGATGIGVGAIVGGGVLALAGSAYAETGPSAIVAFGLNGVIALVHWITILVRQRSVLRPPPFCVPLFPLVPVTGGLACAVLAGYEGWAVPSAGIIVTAWLSVGGVLFLGLFAHRARLADASSEALDPELVRLRGHSPLVLVPIANPNNARSLADSTA
jgi:hypothetical protein